MNDYAICPKCLNDGYVDTFDDDGFPNGAADCPDLGEDWHAPFNYSGIFDSPTTGSGG